VTLIQSDPTWALEYKHFKTLCATGRGSNIETDIQINTWLAELADKAMKEPTR
jgi:hypothetical protein